jgi:hypothetical protein
MTDGGPVAAFCLGGPAYAGIALGGQHVTAAVSRGDRPVGDHHWLPSMHMGLMDRLLGRTRDDRTSPTPATAPPARPAPPTVARTAPARTTPQPAVRSPSRQGGLSAADIGDEANHRWYAAPDGNAQRFIGEDGRLTVHLIRYGQGQDAVLRFCEDSTGLLVGPTDRRLLPAGLLVSNLRGGRYNESDCRAGDFSPAARVRLVPEPNNPMTARR